MEKEAIQAYSTRITQANRSELVVITYEIILDEVRCAEQALAGEDQEGFRTGLKKARQFLNELMASLDYQYEISADLMSLYIYTDKQLVAAISEKAAEPLKPVVMVLEKLLTGFREAGKQDTSQPLMLNTQKLYAGLTYGKGHLNETFVSVNEASRGFKA